MLPCLTPIPKPRQMLGTKCKADEPNVARVAPAEILTVVAAVCEHHDLLLIDTPGQSSGSNSVLRAADLCLIPGRPAPATMDSARNLGKLVAFVLARHGQLSAAEIVAEGECAVSSLPADRSEVVDSGRPPQ